MEVNTIRHETDTLYDTARSGLSYNRASSFASTDRLTSQSAFGTTDRISEARNALHAETYLGRQDDERQAAVNTLYPDRARMQAQTQVAEPEVRRESKPTARLFVGESFSAFDTTAAKSDIAPSLTTMQYADCAPKQEIQAVSAPARAPLSRKTKMAIAIYSAIVVVIAALVIVTGAMIGSIAGDVAALNTQVANQQTAIAQSTEVLDAVTSQDYVTDRAQNELGLSNAGSAQKVSLVAVQTPVTYQAPSNGFDRFCDWLTKVFA